MIGLAALAILLAQPAHPAPLEQALEYVESRGNPMARNGVHRGLWQVNPRFATPTVRKHPWLLHLPPVGRAEGRRALAYWQHRCGGRLRCALAAYNCGNAGVHGKCGRGYAAEVLRLARAP